MQKPWTCGVFGSRLLTEGQSWVYIVGIFIPTGILGVMMGSIPFLGFQSNSTDALAYSSYICTMSNTHCVLIMYLHHEQPFLMSIFAISWMCRDRSDDTGKEQSKVTQCKVTAKLNSIPTFLPFLERVCRDRTHDTGKEQTKMTQCKYTAQFNKCNVHCARRKLEDLLPMTRTLLLSFYLDHSFFVRAQLWGWTSKTVSEVLIIAKL